MVSAVPPARPYDGVVACTAAFSAIDHAALRAEPVLLRGATRPIPVPSADAAGKGMHGILFKHRGCLGHGPSLGLAPCSEAHGCALATWCVHGCGPWKPSSRGYDPTPALGNVPRAHCSPAGPRSLPSAPSAIGRQSLSPALCHHRVMRMIGAVPRTQLPPPRRASRRLRLLHMSVPSGQAFACAPRAQWSQPAARPQGGEAARPQA